MPESPTQIMPSRRPPGLSVRATVAERDVALDVTARPGRILAVLGANGAGKSTLVHLVSGLLRPSSGEVRLGDRVLASEDVLVPAHERHLGLLAQDDLLFPHLSVLENVAFGPRAHGTPARAAREIARARLTEVDAAHLAARRPAQLSGGQRRRVALARALAAEPSVVLLDEPLAALDVDVAARMRRLLTATLRDGEHTVVLVTHDLLDVLALADDVVVLEAGRAVESGPALDVLQRPRSAFLARLAGLVLLPGTISSGADAGFATVDVGGAAITGRVRAEAAEAAQSSESEDTAGGVGAPEARSAELVRPGAAALVSFRPSSVSLFAAGQTVAGSPRNIVDLTVTSLEPLGGTMRVRGHVSGKPDGGAVIAADVTPGAAAELGIVEGMRIRAAFKATEVDVDVRPGAHRSNRSTHG